MATRIGWATGGWAGKRKLAAVLAVSLAGMGLALAPTMAQSATTSRFKTVADAFVDQSNANRNFGTAMVLRTGNSPVRRSYLRFNVSGLPGSPTKATLRLYATAATTVGSRVSGVAGAWGEKTITAASAPAPGAVVSTSPPTGSGRWISVDVTPLVTGVGIVNLALTDAGGAAAYASRESGANSPAMVVETGATTTQPTTTTTTTTAGGGDGGCNATPTARQARYNILGYLFGDGHWGTGGYSYRARSTCKETRMKANIKAAGINATVDANKFHFPKVAPFDRPQDFGPSPETAAGVATADDLRWFLAGIIEGEGSGSGKVLDDPTWGRVAGVVDLYRRLGVVVKPDHAPPACNCPTGTGFWNTFVDPSAPTATYNGYIAIIRSFPFADTTRVPKPR